MLYCSRSLFGHPLKNIFDSSYGKEEDEEFIFLPGFSCKIKLMHFFLKVAELSLTPT